MEELGRRFPWLFWRLERENGRLFVFIQRRNLGAEPDIQPVLAVLESRFGARLDGMPFSPYNIMYALTVRGISVTLVDDNWPCSYFVAEEGEEGTFMQLMEDLRAELEGEWTA